jgi:long-chain acyl-CoA synthetase
MRKSVLVAVRHTPAVQPALDDGVRHVSFGDLNQMVEQERRWLDSFIVRDCALVAENSCGWVISDLALLAGDAVNVAIPNNFTAEQIGYALHDSAVEFVLIETRLRACAEQAGFAKVGLSNRTGLTLLHRRDAHGRRTPEGVIKVSYRAQGVSAPQAMLFEAAMIEHAAEQLLQAQQRAGVTRHLSFLPLTSVLENIGGVYVPLLLGGEVLLKTRAIAAMSCTPTGVETLLEALRHDRPHSVALTPELLGALVNAIDRDSQSVSEQLLQRALALGLPITQWELTAHGAEPACGTKASRTSPPARAFAVQARSETAADAYRAAS